MGSEMSSMGLVLGFFPSLGVPELVVLAIIVLLLFGNRLPSVMRSLGQSITEFKKGTREESQDLDHDSKDK
ncbi:MAG: twin-arginine translocase TatA/TatE family subunit [Planctomycetaceae bacterium]